MKTTRSSLLLLLLALLSTDCRLGKTIEAVQDLFRSPETDPIRRELKFSVPIGYAAVGAMAAVAGESVDGVRFTRSLSGSSGIAEMKITVPASASLPAGMKGGGEISVAGYWSSANFAVLSIDFATLTISEKNINLRVVSTIPVERDHDTIRLMYEAMDINANLALPLTSFLSLALADSEEVRLANRPLIDSGTSVDVDVHILSIHLKGTPGVLSDDSYHCWGALEHAGIGKDNLEAALMLMVDAKVTSACRANPVSGWVLLKNVGVTTTQTRTISPQIPNIGSALMLFHEECDGKVEVPVATGVYITAIGQDVSLSLPQ